MTATLTAREAPTKKASKTRGNRMTQMIETSLFWIFSSSGRLNSLCPIIDKISRKSMFELPMMVPIHIINTTNGIASRIKSLRLLV